MKSHFFPKKQHKSHTITKVNKNKVVTNDKPETLFCHIVFTVTHCFSTTRINTARSHPKSAKSYRFLTFNFFSLKMLEPKSFLRKYSFNEAKLIVKPKMKKTGRELVIGFLDKLVYEDQQDTFKCISGTVSY